jgi:hypothetical protein
MNFEGEGMAWDAERRCCVTGVIRWDRERVAGAVFLILSEVWKGGDWRQGRSHRGEGDELFVGEKNWPKLAPARTPKLPSSTHVFKRIGGN